MNISAPRTGYDLAKALFHECGGKNIDALVDFAGGEKDWLEFKAGLFARSQDLREGENQDDALWHVARAVFGFLNSSGGMIILGIDDKNNPVDACLGAKGELLASMTPDEALRKAEDQLPPRKSKWCTGTKGQWSWSKEKDRIPADAVSLECAKYRGHLVILVFVRPIRKREGVFVAGPKGDTLIIRREGGRGRLETLTAPRDCHNWINRERQVERVEFSTAFEDFKRFRKETVAAKRSAKASNGTAKRSFRKGQVSRAAADRLLCPNCGTFIAVPTQDGKAKCPDCGQAYKCGVHQPNFVSATDDNSDGWAVAKWLLLSFERWNPRRDTDAKLREALHVDKEYLIATPGVSPGDFQAVLEQHGLEVENNDEDTYPLDGNDIWMRHAFGDGKRIAVRYSRSHLDRNWYWIGLELFDGHIRVMDPREAYGYMSLADWRRLHGSEVSKFDTVFAVAL